MHSIVKDECSDKHSIKYSNDHFCNHCFNSFSSHIFKLPSEIEGGTCRKNVQLFWGTKKDKDIAEFFRLIDYSVNGWYNKGFHKSDYEQIVDNTLIQFNHIVYLYDQKLLTKEEFEQYRYEIDKIVHNIDVQRYFFNLYHYSQRVGLSFKFDKLLKYAWNH